MEENGICTERKYWPTKTQKRKNQNVLRECTGKDNPGNKEMLTVWAVV